jgi:COMPASS component SWD3
MGSMDASHAIVDLDATSHNVVAKFKDHRKHVVRTRWAPNGKLLASASYDGEVHVYAASSDAVDSAYTKIKTLTFKHAVEAIVFTADSQWLIAAPREDNYLHYFHTETWKEKLVNMNSSGDEHVSFTAMDLVMSNDGKTLLTSTDKNRVIMFAVGTSIQARNFWGVENGQWSTPRSCFNLSQSCVYTTSEDNNVYIFDVGTEKKNGTKLAGHKGVIRDIHRHASKELVTTCSYDRSVKVWM